MKSRPLLALAAFALAAVAGPVRGAGDLPDSASDLPDGAIERKSDLAQEAGPVRAAVSLLWQDDYDKALVDAKDRHKLVLLDFSATWCGPCRMMANTTFADASVQKLLAPFVLVRVDIDRQPTLADRYKVDAVPTCIILNQFGETVDRRMGYTNAEGFSQWVQASAKLPGAKAAEPKSAVGERNIKHLGWRIMHTDPAAKDPHDTLIGSEVPPGPVARAISVTDLLAIYCAPGAQQGPPSGSPDAAEDVASAKLVESELRDFVQQFPAAAAPYLNEPRLTVRILFTTLFAAANPGEDFPFDPWAPAADRATQAEAWSKRVQNR